MTDRVRTQDSGLPSRVTLYIDTVAFAGTERHMLDLALGLAALGVPATLACPAESPLAARAAARGVPVAAVPRGARAALPALRALLGDGRAILHVHNGRTAALAAGARLAGGRGRVVKTQHFVSPAHAARTGPRAFLSRAAHGWVNRRVARFLAISEAVRAQMLARGEAGPRRVSLVPNGLSGVDVPPQSAGAVRAEFGAGPDAPLVACVARLEPEKDVGTLLRAMALVRAARPDARLLVAGEGSERAALESLARELGLQDVVRFAGFREDARAFIAACDVFALPSLEEPFGLVLLEAMALGRPVVATATGGPLEIVAGGETGRLVPPSDPEALAGALLSLLSDPEAASRMGAAGRARYERLYTAETMAAGTIEAYRRVLSRGR